MQRTMPPGFPIVAGVTSQGPARLSGLLMIDMPAAEQHGLGSCNNVKSLGGLFFN